MNLDNILDIDIQMELVKVEPSVTIGMLNKALVSVGYTLVVVPELDQLTVGRYWRNNFTLTISSLTVDL